MTWRAVAATTALAAALTGLFIFRRTVDIDAAELQQLTVPGSHELSLPRAGRYTIFHERRSNLDGRYYATDRDLSGLHLRLSTADGRDVSILQPLRPSGYSLPGRQGIAIAAFEVASGGSYRLTAGYDDREPHVMAVLAVGALK